MLTRTLSLVVPEIVLVFACYILAAYWTGGADPSVFLLYDNGLLQIAIVVAGVLLGLHLNNLYVHVGVRSKILLAQQLCLTLGVTFLLESLLSYLRNPYLLLAPAIMMIGSALTLVALLLWRMFYSAVLRSNFGARRVLFLGAGAAAREAGSRLEARPELGLTLAGYVEAEGLRSSGELARVITEARPDRIAIGVHESRETLPLRELLDLQLAGVEIQPVAELYEAACERICMSELLPSQLIFSDELGARRGAIALQAIYSNIVALAGLALLAVLFLPIAIAIKLTSAGPVIEKHTRWGLNLVPFTLNRFRCRRGDGQLSAPGRWMRRLHLDALPQLLNVIRGEMSLVGPRPHHPEFVPVLMEQMPYYGQRHAVRPGILGWSQLNCDYDGRMRDARVALEYDLYYIKHMSPALDAYIVLHSLMESPFRPE